MKSLAYLVSEFPALSHTFIYSEIRELKRLGFAIFPVSVNPSRHLEKMSIGEQAMAKETYYLKDTGLMVVLWSLIMFGLRRPVPLLRMFCCAWKDERAGVRSVFKSLGYFIEAILLVNWMRQRQLNHVHVHFGNAAANVARIGAASGLISYSLSIHGPDIFDDVTLNLLRQKVEGSVFTRCISYYSKTQVMRLIESCYWKKLHIVRCGIDVDAFVPLEKKKRSVRDLISVGRLSVAKGQMVLLEAMKLLKEASVAVKLRIIGGGDQEAILREYVVENDLSDYVELVGPAGHSEVIEAYKNADLFVLPSFAEGLPVVIMEAMAMGLPVIATAIMGIPEIVRDGETGFLVPPGDAGLLAEKIKMVVEDFDELSAVGRNGRREVEGCYLINKNVQDLAKLFEFECGSA